MTLSDTLASFLTMCSNLESPLFSLNFRVLKRKKQDEMPELRQRFPMMFDEMKLPLQEILRHNVELFL